ncbi:hypothetical protein IGS74_17165 [Aureimonas sp. OT7]|nr:MULTISPECIES: hypothetical protein [Aureimonas]QOG06242.1 hypothetical protein IGS74_17165 [Aureimonas sp. OT7]
MAVSTKPLQFCLLMALLALTAPVRADDSMAIARCEAGVVAAIQNPSSYRRGAVESKREPGSKNYVMVVSFEAANIYGEPIAAKAYCFFRQMPPSPREKENCPECQVYVLDGLSIAGAFRPGDTEEPRIVSGGS